MEEDNWFDGNESCFYSKRTKTQIPIISLSQVNPEEFPNREIYLLKKALSKKELEFGSWRVSDWPDDFPIEIVEIKEHDDHFEVTADIDGSI